MSISLIEKYLNHYQIYTFRKYNFKTATRVRIVLVSHFDFETERSIKITDWKHLKIKMHDFKMNFNELYAKLV